MKTISIILLLLCCFALKADLDNAHNIYTNELKDAKQGLYVKDDIAFVIVIIKDKLKNNLYEATGMLRSKALIDKYIRETQQKTKKVSLVDSQYISNIINNNKSLSYTISRSRVLENGQRKDGYHYVVAISSKELNAIKKNTSPVNNNIQTSFTLLKSAKQDFIQTEESEKIKKIYLEMGSIESALSYDNNDGIGYEYNLVTYTEIKDYIKFLKNCEKANKLIKSKGLAKPQQIATVLSLCPANYQALSALKSHLKVQTQPVSELLISFALKSYSSSNPVSIKQLKAATTNKTVIEEYVKLIDRLNDYVRKNKASKDIVQKYVHRTFGHVNFSSGCNNKSNKYLEKAKELFKSGTNLSQIIEDLYLAAQLSPRNIEVWSYLGATMLASKEYELGTIYLNQALFLNPTNSSVKVNLAQTYSKLNFANLAKGMALDALTDKAELSEYEQMICLKILR